MEMETRMVKKEASKDTGIRRASRISSATSRSDPSTCPIHKQAAQHTPEKWESEKQGREGRG